MILLLQTKRRYELKCCFYLLKRKAIASMRDRCLSRIEQEMLNKFSEMFLKEQTLPELLKEADNLVLL